MLPYGFMRLQKEMENIKRRILNKNIQFVEILELEEFEHATFLFAGPIDSPYQGFWFRIKMEWPTDYPFRPPKCTLLDKIWNPYVDYETNQICVDILSDQHSPALKTIDIILSITSLLGESKLNQTNDGFANPEAAIQMIKNYHYFYQQTRKICEISSYKRQQIYSDEMRGLPEEHIIVVETHQLPSMIAEELESKKFHKKQPQCKLQEKIQEKNESTLREMEAEKPAQVSQQNEFQNSLSSEQLEYIQQMNILQLDSIQEPFNFSPEANVGFYFLETSAMQNLQPQTKPQPLPEQQFNQLVEKQREKVLQRLDEKEKLNQKEKLSSQTSPSNNNM